MMSPIGTRNWWRASLNMLQNNYASCSSFSFKMILIDQRLNLVIYATISLRLLQMKFIVLSLIKTRYDTNLYYWKSYGYYSYSFVHRFNLSVQANREVIGHWNENLLYEHYNIVWICSTEICTLPIYYHTYKYYFGNNIYDFHYLSFLWKVVKIAFYNW